jgi:hypothetical protein
VALFFIDFETFAPKKTVTEGGKFSCDAVAAQK